MTDVRQAGCPRGQAQRRPFKEVVPGSACQRGQGWRHGALMWVLEKDPGEMISRRPQGAAVVCSKHRKYGPASGQGGVPWLCQEKQG